jgi:hypothetical protein
MFHYSSSTLLKFFGGKVHELEALLVEERLLDGWEPTERARVGLTMAAFNGTVFAVAMGVPSDPVVLEKLVKDAEAAQADTREESAGTSTAVERQP